ncbi:MAG: RloB domain-containing protein [Flavobacteriia bacterium]|nr:RloB domain-containing protein [Flavobacteriia bacterium]OJX39159.1 MAG: hypothetical protein BGO87_04020 [Flavobacteriia bacterium 40-80]
MNSRKKRGYSRELPQELVRDYRLFAIACEGGKREPDYFKLFEHFSTRVKVDVIEKKVLDEELFHKHETKSSPKWVLDRAIHYVEQEGLIDEDELWFVMDIDKWEISQLHEIIQYCNEKENWNVVLSNPCFEVWLYLHKKDNFDSTESKKCDEFKFEISEFDKGGYNPLNFIYEIRTAYENAKKLDSDSNNQMPKLLETKVYLLTESIFKFVSEKQFEDFLNIKLPKLISEQRKGLKKSKVRVALK